MYKNPITNPFFITLINSFVPPKGLTFSLHAAAILSFSMATPSESLTLRKVLSESERIIKPRRHHFQALSLLFLFPLSICSLLYLTTIPKIPHNLLDSDDQETPNQFLIPLLYTLVSNLLFILSAASISFSTYRVSRDEPVDLISSLKSIFPCFWPFVSTSLVTGLIVLFVTIPFLVSVILVSKWLNQSSYFLPSVVLISLISVVGMIYLRVNWILAYVVVVVESKWGYAPLKRSADLVKGNRGVSLKMVLYFEVVIGMAYWVFYQYLSWMGGWWFVLLLVLVSFCVSQVMLLYFVAIAVLYVYCWESKEGGLPSQINSPEKFPLVLDH